MDHDPSKRPTSAMLLQKRPLLSEEQKKLIAEQNKVKAAYESLAMQKEMLLKLSPPKTLKPKRKLHRSSTWDVGMMR